MCVSGWEWAVGCGWGCGPVPVCGGGGGGGGGPQHPSSQHSSTTGMVHWGGISHQLCHFYSTLLEMSLAVFAGLSSTMSFWVFWRHFTLLFLFLLVSNQLFRFDVTWHDWCCFCCSLINYSMSFVQYVTWHDDYFRWCWF